MVSRNTFDLYGFEVVAAEAISMFSKLKVKYQNQRFFEFFFQELETLFLWREIIFHVKSDSSVDQFWKIC